MRKIIMSSTFIIAFALLFLGVIMVLPFPIEIQMFIIIGTVVLVAQRLAAIEKDIRREALRDTKEESVEVE